MFLKCSCDIFKSLKCQRPISLKSSPGNFLGIAILCTQCLSQRFTIECQEIKILLIYFFTINKTKYRYILQFCSGPKVIPILCRFIKCIPVYRPKSFQDFHQMDPL